MTETTTPNDIQALLDAKDQPLPDMPTVEDEINRLRERRDNLYAQINAQKDRQRQIGAWVKQAEAAALQLDRIVKASEGRKRAPKA